MSASSPSPLLRLELPPRAALVFVRRARSFWVRSAVGGLVSVSGPEFRAALAALPSRPVPVSFLPASRSVCLG